MKVKCLTLYQPWASLIAARKKTIETRHWRAPNSLIGEYIAIHAGKKYVYVPYPRFQNFLILCLDESVRKNYPAGKVLCIARLDSCVQIKSNGDLPGMPERIFGDFSKGRWMWNLSGIRLFDPPIATRGRQGLWDFEFRTSQLERWDRK